MSRGTAPVTPVHQTLVFKYSITTVVNTLYRCLSVYIKTCVILQYRPVSLFILSAAGRTAWNS